MGPLILFEPNEISAIRTRCECGFNDASGRVWEFGRTPCHANGGTKRTYERRTLAYLKSATPQSSNRAARDKVCRGGDFTQEMCHFWDCRAKVQTAEMGFGFVGGMTYNLVAPREGC